MILLLIDLEVIFRVACGSSMNTTSINGSIKAGVTLECLFCWLLRSKDLGNAAYVFACSPPKKKPAIKVTNYRLPDTLYRKLLSLVLIFFMLVPNHNNSHFKTLYIVR